ncbi:hypothetical protein LZK98_08335 [Sphingomonas cannabina]|uniref:hypothetical protein n=1 Tax=Sphingomonas cannabina TaxID=2899123 RepID=UPI001F3401EA|nr:hypothetical protein [Sphingomonas cannabina]UIJ46937.1 hypothetical protein LZK98_08335 [Sphingomonas cannabina]
MSVEDELCLTRVVATRLLALLQHRRPSVADEFLGALAIDARATVDRTFEAILVLFFRHSIEVSPCRKLLDSQVDDKNRFVLARPNGQAEVIDEEQLMMMAGIDA